MKVTRLGQAGLLFAAGDTTVLVDPYFTDSVPGVPRRKQVPERVWDIKPDILLITHDHIDHYDPETVKRFVNENTAATLLSPKSVWEKLPRPARGNNYVLVSPGVQWTQDGITVTAVKARHSDPYAVGFALNADGKSIYITGDTLFFLDVSLPFESVDYVFLPINGRGNNMNAGDAAEFAGLIGAKTAVPVHYGLLDDLSPDIFEYKNKFVMEDFTEYDI